MRKAFRRMLERLHAGAKGYVRGRASTPTVRSREPLRLERSLTSTHTRSQG